MISKVGNYFKVIMRSMVDYFTSILFYSLINEPIKQMNIFHNLIEESLFNLYVDRLFVISQPLEIVQLNYEMRNGSENKS